MTRPESSETWFDAVAKVGADIEGVHRVFAGGKGGANEAKVVPMSRELMTDPTLVQGYAGAEITAGSWESQTHTLECAIWLPSGGELLGAAYSLAIAFIARVMAAYPARAKAYELSDELQSVLVTEFGAIEGRVWGDPDARRDYVVLPYTLEVIVRKAAAYESH